MGKYVEPSRTMYKLQDIVGSCSVTEARVLGRDLHQRTQGVVQTGEDTYAARKKCPQWQRDVCFLRVQWNCRK